VERVDLERVRHADRDWWRNGGVWDERAAKILVGVLADGRWYARRYSGGVSRTDEHMAYAYAEPNSEHYARATARRWMRTIGGEWVEA
jgi:hypothetical protein